MMENHLHPVLIPILVNIMVRGKSSVVAFPNEMRSNVSTKKLNVAYMTGKHAFTTMLIEY